MRTHNIIYSILICFSFIGLAQGQVADPRLAKYHYQQGDYVHAIQKFNLLLKVTPGEKKFQ